METIIQVTTVSKKYDNHVSAVKEVTFDIASSEVVCVLGQSGSGKSTLLKIIGGLEDADKGEVVILDQKITGPSNNLVAGYNFIHFVPQDYRLPPFRTIGQTLDDELYDIKDDKTRENRIAELLSLCRIEGKNDAYPRQLSGGERQRAAIAIALADDPEIILMDEPFSNLDILLKREVRSEIFEILREAEATVVLVSHHPSDALSVADRVMIMQSGELVQMGTPKELYQNPLTPYVAKIFGPINFIKVKDGEDRNKQLIVRPEEIVITDGGKYKGTVKKCLFHGMHYHLYIASDICDADLLVYHKTPVHVGEKVEFIVGQK